MESPADGVGQVWTQTLFANARLVAIPPAKRRFATAILTRRQFISFQTRCRLWTSDLCQRVLCQLGAKPEFLPATWPFAVIDLASELLSCFETRRAERPRAELRKSDVYFYRIHF